MPDSNGIIRSFWLEVLSFVRLSAMILSLGAGVGGALAQDVTGRNLPVINPQPDINGVDVATGQYSVISPFGFNAPGAGNLNVRTVYNGRKFTSTINSYLDDQTLTRPDIGDPNERQIRVHLGGVDRLFVCQGLGVCTQIAKIDGSRLTRSAATSYEFRDNAGTLVTFFPAGIQPLPYCYDVETGCNAAEYNAYAYAKTIRYTNGETLTFADFPTVESGQYVDTVTSNLGYSLDVITPCSPCSVNTAYPGAYWLIHRVGASSTTFRLKKGSSALGAISSSRTFTPGGASDYETMTITDQLSRQFRVDTRADQIEACGSQGPPQGLVYDRTNFLPRTVTSPGNRVTTIGYMNVTAFYQGFNVVPVTSVTRGGRTWSYNYTINGWLGGTDATLTSTDPVGGIRSARAIGNEVPWQTEWGNSTWCNVQTASSDVIETTNEIAKKNIFTYAMPGTVGSATLPEQNGYTYDRDPRGNITRITAAAKPGTASPIIVYEAGYDAACSNPVTCNKPNWTRDANAIQSGQLQHRTDYIYDPVHGGPTQVTQPADASGIRPQQRLAYESVSTPGGTLYRLQQSAECRTIASCAGTADEVVRTFTYWGTTLLKSTETVTSNGTSLTVGYAYDDAGREIQKTAPKGGITHSFYDTVGRKIGTISEDPDGAGPLPRIATRTSYNLEDEIIQIDEGATTGTTAQSLAGMTVFRSTIITFDDLGQKIKEVVTGGSVSTVTQFSYDGAGRLECTAVRMEPWTWTSLPTDACIQASVSTSDVDDRITKNTYDAAGKLLKVEHGVGTSVRIDYARYEYTPNGKQEAVIDANGNRAEFSYDGHDRRVKWAFPSKTAVGQVDAPGPTQDAEHYEYDLNGNRVSLRKRDGRTIAFAYDALNRVTSKTYPGGGARPVYYAYDSRGLQTMARFDSLSGQGVTNAYDGFGRLTATTAVMNLGSTEVIRNLNFAYDANGNRTRMWWPDSMYADASWDELDRFYYSVLPGGTQINFVFYDTAGRTGTLLRWAAGTWGASTTYGYDSISRLSSYWHSFQNSAADVTTSFTYNPASQIVSRTRDNDDYRFTGNVNVDRAYMRNGLNQYTQAGSKSFTYDANGNLISDGTTGYTYDIENRLISTSAGVTLSYDPLGRLAQTYSPSTGTTQFVYDGDALVAEYDGTGAMTKRYVHGPQGGVDDPLVEYVGSGVTSPRHLMADHQGSIIALADINGNRVAVNGYDEYGIPNGEIVNGQLVPTNTGRFQYTGQAWIPELGMYHYKARVYSPTLGRFLQTDPIGYDDQINLYAYVANDPLNGRDPTGMKCTAAETSLTCDPPGAEIGTYTVPLPKGHGVSGISESGSGYDSYKLSASTAETGADLKQAVTDEVVRDPTPGFDNPASPGGTLNDAGINPVATFGPLGDLVSSFVTTDSNGNTVVVNVAAPGNHIFAPAVVSQVIRQTSSGTSITLVGESQSRIHSGGVWNPINAAAKGIFQRKINGDISQARRKVGR